MKIEHNGTLMRIYVSQSRRHQHMEVYQLIVKAMAEAGLAGATVFFGIEGYGSHRHISSSHVVDSIVDLPVLIEAVDEDDKIRSFLPRLETLLDDGLVTLERLQTVFYRRAAATE